MSDNETDSGRVLSPSLRTGLELGLALFGLLFAVAILTDTIKDPIPNDVWALIWFAVAAAFLVRAVRLHMQS